MLDGQLSTQLSQQSEGMTFKSDTGGGGGDVSVLSHVSGVLLGSSWHADVITRDMSHPRLVSIH